MYSLEYLINKFEKHSKEYVKQHQENIDKFKENNPNEPLPEYMKDDFNLPEALKLMCIEIQKKK